MNLRPASQRSAGPKPWVSSGRTSSKPPRSAVASSRSYDPGHPNTGDHSPRTGAQIQELERQFAENDRQYWDDLGRSYGWTPQQTEEVWNWFGQRTPKASDQQTFGSQGANS